MIRVSPLRLPALLTATALALAPLTALAEDMPALITVTGEGVVQAVPDLATIPLGVTTEAETAAAAMAANNAAVQAVLDRLKAAGIEAKDVQTSNLSLNPNWVQTADGSAPRISGYVANNMLTVQVRSLDSLGTVLDAVITDGANTLNGITFGLQDPRPVLDDARRKAVEDARARAEVLAGAAGVKLGRLVSMQEGGAIMPPQPMYRMEAAMASPVPVAAGEVGLSSSVTLVYEIAE